MTKHICTTHLRLMKRDKALVRRLMSCAHKYEGKRLKMKMDDLTKNNIEV